ncbi:hypothetical protein [Haematomicrobium sanguinis]|uniref:hypothetical protein n=1 Tax=Haematomicrobium sanguinis TaxID=479106 RepID=UPI00047E63AC|nr:hypothetical protein [Haematomicrobium sanguinis]
MSATLAPERHLRRPVKVGGGGARRRSVWGLFDQAVSSLANFVLGLAVARMVNPVDFGLFALAFGMLMMAQSMSRSLSSEPFAVRYSMRKDLPRRGVSAVLGTALAVGLIAALLALAAAAALSLSGAGAEAVALALVLALTTPLVLLHDALRSVFLALGKPQRAVAINLGYALILAGSLVGLTATDTTTASGYLLWGNLAYAPAVIAGLILLGVVPRISRTGWWLHRHRELWPRFSVDAMVTSGVQQAILMLVAFVAGLAAAGQFRLILILLGPIAVLVQGIWAVAVPELVRHGAVQENNPATGRKMSRVYGGVTVAVSGTWAAALLVVPANWLSAVAGESIQGALVLLPALAIAQVLNSFNIGSIAGIRALGAARRGMWTRILTSALRLAGTGLGIAVAALLGGNLALGAAWGLAAGTLLNVVGWHLSYRQATREWDLTRSHKGDA